MIYEYECEDGHIFERYLPISRYDDLQTCECGKTSIKIISAPSVMADIEPFMSTSGEYITSRAQWREHLKETDCVELGRSDLEYMRKQEEKRRSSPIKDPERKERIKWELEKRGL